MGRSEELGTGIRNVYKYSKAYSGSDKIVFSEEDVFMSQVPLEYHNLRNVESNDDLIKASGDLQKDLQKDIQKDLENFEILSENQKEILNAIKRDRKITQKKLSAIVGINEKNIRNNINFLKNKGMVRRIGPDKGGHWEILSGSTQWHTETLKPCGRIYASLQPYNPETYY